MQVRSDALEPTVGRKNTEHEIGPGPGDARDEMAMVLERPARLRLVGEESVEPRRDWLGRIVAALKVEPQRAEAELGRSRSKPEPDQPSP